LPASVSSTPGLPDIDLSGATVGDPQLSAAAARVGAGAGVGGFGAGGAGVGGFGAGGAGVGADMGAVPPPEVPDPRELALEADAVPAVEDPVSFQHP
jgi:hypothetical protein